ncbi:hypothetical protein ACQV5M_08485 [Leptospira sp. SA-E8]|uniref:hypothetical protein n=1 Tax=Leptospira sp. SA-E8 TaxID=3422259 RepID=UPI003EBE968C
MKSKKTLILILIPIILLLLENCKNNSEESNSSLTMLALALNLQNDPVADASSSGIDSVMESMETLTTDDASVADFSHKKNSKSFTEKFLDLLFPPLEAMNATVSCLGGGSYSRTVTSGTDFYDGPSSSFSVTRSLHSCKFFPFGASYHDGETQVYWNNLSGSSPYIQASTQLRIAPDRSITNTRRVNKTFTVVGNGAVIASPGDQKIGVSVDWTSASSTGSSYTISIDETREVKNSAGDVTVRHTVTTPSSLSVTTDKTEGTRKINGTLEIDHDIAGFVVTLTFNDAVWNYSNCLPVSGNITLDVTGNKPASGTITLSPGSLSYSYSGQRRSGSGTIDPGGCQ